MSFNKKYCFRNNHFLKGAVVVTLCQNEADVKFQMDIDLRSISMSNFTDNFPE